MHFIKLSGMQIKQNYDKTYSLNDDIRRKKNEPNLSSNQGMLIIKQN